MKLTLTLGFLLVTISAFATESFANGGTYFCYGEDGSDQSITVDLDNSFARLDSEDDSKEYALSGVLESLPPIYVFGDRAECSIRFKTSRDLQKGQANFSCNKEKYPNSVELEMACSKR
jgi:hypothetical protein